MFIGVVIGTDIKLVVGIAKGLMSSFFWDCRALPQEIFHLGTFMLSTGV